MHGCRVAVFLCAVVALAGCRTVANTGALLPTRHNHYRDGIAIYTDFELSEQEQLLDELVAMRQQVIAKLNLSPSAETVHVFLFRSPEKFESYITKRYPQLPHRRAFFVREDGMLKVYAHWGERIKEDLRHETTHAIVHASINDVPLWLDEGLAEMFETPAGARGIHHAHAAYLANEKRRGAWQPDLRRLEALQAMGQMTQLDYAESWLWTHWLLNSPEGRQLVLAHLGTLENEPRTNSIWAELADKRQPAPAMVAQHLDSLDVR